jgi:hypothetical protein
MHVHSIFDTLHLGCITSYDPEFSSLIKLKKRNLVDSVLKLLLGWLPVENFSGSWCSTNTFNLMSCKTLLASQEGSCQAKTGISEGVLLDAIKVIKVQLIMVLTSFRLFRTRVWKVVIANLLVALCVLPLMASRAALCS